MRFRLVSAVFLVLGVAFPASARTFYVSSASGSDSTTAPGTATAPFRTIQRAVSEVQAGDAVVVRAGRYPPFVLRNIHGRPGAPITFEGEPGAIIDSYGSNKLRDIEFYDASSYITIAGFEITYSGPQPGYGDCQTRPPNRTGRNGIKINPANNGGISHHLVFKNINIHHMPTQGILGVANDSEFSNSRSHHNGSALAAEQAYGTYLKGKNWLISGNQFHDNNGHGIRTGNDYGGNAGYGATNNVTPQHMLLVDSVIANNVIYGNGGKFVHSSGPTGCRIVTEGDGIVIWHGSGNIVRNNVIYSNTGNGIRVRSDNILSTKANLVYNNTVYNNALERVDFFGLYASNGNTAFRNNISYGNAGGRNAKFGTGNVESNNLVGVNPLFMDATGDNFRLRPGSPAIDKGMTLQEVLTDFWGVRRPRGNAYDIGAYEVMGGGTKPQEPRSLKIR